MKAFNYETAFKKASALHDKLQAKYLKADRARYRKFRWKWIPSEHVARAFEWAMDWKPRLKLFKYKRRSACTFNPYTCTATSYDWWVFVRVIKGKVVFNEYAYSHTTRSHQSMVRSLLRELGIKVHLTLSTRNSLTESLRGALDGYYTQLAKLQVEQANPSNRTSRKGQIYWVNRKINQIKALGGTSSKCFGEFKREAEASESYRKSRLAERALERRNLRERIKLIQRTDALKLDVRQIHTETNAEIRRALLNKIGIERLITDLNATVIAEDDNYTLYGLDIGDGTKRPYLKMVNPSTGDLHFEGVPNHVTTIEAALAYRNPEGVYVKPIVLT